MSILLQTALALLSRTSRKKVPRADQEKRDRAAFEAQRTRTRSDSLLTVHISRGFVKK